MYVHAGSNSFFTKLYYLQISEQGVSGSGFGTFEGLCFLPILQRRMRWRGRCGSTGDRQTKELPLGGASQAGEGGALEWDANPKQ